MRKVSLEACTPDHIKRRVIVIPNAMSLEPSLPDKQVSCLMEHLKQNANVNQGNLQHVTTSFKPQILFNDTPRSQGFKPSGEMTPLHVEVILNSLCQLKQQIGSLATRLGSMEQRLMRIDEKDDSYSHPGLKKKRRKADEIVKSYYCVYPNCSKSYGSQMSLNLHLKLKHIRDEHGQVSDQRQNVSSIDESQHLGDDKISFANKILDE